MTTSNKGPRSAQGAPSADNSNADNSSHGERRRQSIIAAAIDLSTRDGLQGVSFATLAAATGLTKAGVAAHFSSKQALQLAAVETAARAYEAALFTAVAGVAAGLPRLEALGHAWFAHLAQLPYQGGCFFGAAGVEFASITGPVRDALASQSARLLTALEEQALLAARLGELVGDVAPRVLAFQIHALAQEANSRRQLHGETDAFELAAAALDDLLTRVRSAHPAHSKPTHWRC